MYRVDMMSGQLWATFSDICLIAKQKSRKTTCWKVTQLTVIPGALCENAVLNN